MNKRITEQDEFLLSRLVDDDLPADEAEALRARLEREPDLKRAFARLTRLDALLLARRGDRPQVDWDQFHRQVMAQVVSEAAPARPAIYTLRNYLRVALPLAAAAAIALMVWFSRGGIPQPMPKPGDGAVPEMAMQSGPTLEVAYMQMKAEGQVEVLYARSDELQAEFEKLDEQNDSAESRGGFVVSGDRQPARAVPRELLAAVASIF